jgi:hypothetical protein
MGCPQIHIVAQDNVSLLCQIRLVAAILLEGQEKVTALLQRLDELVVFS